MIFPEQAILLLFPSLSVCPGTNACDNECLVVSPVSTGRLCPHHDALGMTIRRLPSSRTRQSSV